MKMRKKFTAGLSLLFGIASMAPLASAQDPHHGTPAAWHDPDPCYAIVSAFDKTVIHLLAPEGPQGPGPYWWYYSVYMAYKGLNNGAHEWHAPVSGMSGTYEYIGDGSQCADYRALSNGDIQLDRVTVADGNGGWTLYVDAYLTKIDADTYRLTSLTNY